VPEGPVEPHGTRATPVRVAPAQPEEGAVLLAGLRSVTPRVVVRADLLPAAGALSVTALVGVPLGWVWSRLSPPQESTLSADGDMTPMLMQSYHEFDALAIFLLLGFAVGLLTGAVLWTLRNQRGPVMFVAGVLGSLVAAWLAIRTGMAFAAAEYPMPVAPKVGVPVAVAPKVTTVWAVVAPPLGVALAYGLAASWNGMDDLGRHLR
jgi:hypothetical protein